MLRQLPQPPCPEGSRQCSQSAGEWHLMRQLAICWHDVAQPLGSTLPVCRCPSPQLPSLATQAAAEADTSTSRRLQADLRAPTKELLLSCVAHLLSGLL